MKAIIITGKPGSGKGTQSKMIAEKKYFTHISTGDLLRDEIKNETYIGKMIGSLKNGEFIDDDIILDLVENKIKELIRENVNGLIFDGFPRTIEQAKSLDKILIENNIVINQIITLNVSDEIITERLLSRNINREDDNVEIIKKRLIDYNIKTFPILSYYSNIIEISGELSKEEVFKYIYKILI